MPDIRTRDHHNAADRFLAARAWAEAARQSAHERANRDYARACRAERLVYDATVLAAKHRVFKAEQPIEFIPADYERGTDTAVDAALAELDAARREVDAIPGAPTHAALAAKRDAAIRAADAEFNRALSQGFPAE